MHILFTRPLEDCSEMIIKFKSLGHQVSHLPLLSIDKVDYEKINFSDFKGIIFTSANAVKFLDHINIDKNLLEPSNENSSASKVMISPSITE